MTRITLRTVLAVFLILLAGPALADPITFTFTGTGSGSIGATGFTGADFVVTATGDTDLRYSQGNADPLVPGVFYIDHLTAGIEIEGVGSFAFLATPTRTFLNQNWSGGSGVAGLTRGSFLGTETALFFIGPTSPLLASWDMRSSIGPIDGIGTIDQWTSGDGPILTTGGQLVMNDASTPSTFQAVVGVTTPIPEPESYALLLAGLGLLGFVARRRTR